MDLFVLLWNLTKPCFYNLPSTLIKNDLSESKYFLSRSRSRDRKKRLMDLAHNGSSSSSFKPRQDFKRGPAFDDRVSIY